METCELCEGTGQYVVPAYEEAGQIVDEQTVTCSVCRGTGVMHFSEVYE